MIRHIHILLLAFSFMLGGCQTLFRQDMKLASAEPLFGQDLDHCLDDPQFMIALMAKDTTPDIAAVAIATGQGQNKLTSSDTTGCEDLIKLFQAYLFNSKKENVLNGGTLPKTQRNELIQALVGISNRKCGRYSTHIKTFDGQSNSLLSALAIATGGLGGIATTESAARLLAGTSAVASGSRVAVNDAWFSNQTIQVLVAGYEKERNHKLREIHNRQSCPIELYPTMAGIADVLQYHASCSLTTGLAAAAQAIERSDQPGIEVMRRQLADLSAIRTEAKQFVNGAVNGRPIEVQNQFDKVAQARKELEAAEDRVRLAKRDKKDAEIAAQAAAEKLAKKPEDQSLKDAEADARTLLMSKESILTEEENAQIKAASNFIKEDDALIKMAARLSNLEKERSRFDEPYVARTYSEVVFCPFSTAKPASDDSINTNTATR